MTIDINIKLSVAQAYCLKRIIKGYLDVLTEEDIQSLKDRKHVEHNAIKAEMTYVESVFKEIEDGITKSENPPLPESLTKFLTNKKAIN